MIFGKCYCCGLTEITPFNFEAGHVLAESQGGIITLENLRPICSPCNRSMGIRNMKNYAKLYYSNSLILNEV
jgi:5-methylcytosine-specific restriction endonuclease McrA